MARDANADAMIGAYMPYKFELKTTGCIGCMACVDICPEKALGFKSTGWMTPEEMKSDYEKLVPLKGYPVQVGRCDGCMACKNECVLSGIDISRSGCEPEYEKGDFFRMA